ncbi:MAG: hypothetical protein HYX56_05460, partial [Chloroflexi bacterium]|nr:hypothetical protein [Chloroflexota bacterium]
MAPPRCLIVTEDRSLRAVIHLILDHGEYERKHASQTADAAMIVGEWR